MTKEEITRAKELDLLTYFKLIEPGNLKLVGKEYRHKVHSSLTISKDSLWCWHCIGLRGRTALKYLIDVEKVPYVEAVREIAFFRNQSHLTQEDFAYEVHLSRQYISQLETAACRPSLETIVEIANTLGVSTDDLLVDSLTHSVSTADTEVHRVLIDCNELEAEILTRTLKELRAILYSLGV